MKIITSKKLAKTAYKRWLEVYKGVDVDTVQQNGKTLKYMDAQFLSLSNLNTIPEAIERIVGNKEWTRVPACTYCGHTTDAVVAVRPQTTSRRLYACEECIGEWLSNLRG